MNNQLSKNFKSAGLSESDIQTVFSGIAAMRADEKRFDVYFDQNWSTAFVTSECFYVLISVAHIAYTDYLGQLSDADKAEKKNTLTAINELCRRASQQYLEILTLVRNGFSDGAFARWRSMYELSVICSFIHKYGEPVAEKFIEASDSQDRYDWAMACGEFSEKKRHVTFGDILKLCDMDAEVWKDNYTVANQTVHASPQGTFDRLSDRDSQRSGYGIAAPAIQSANTLALISSMLFSLFPEEKTMDKMSLAAKWLDELTEAYVETHEKLFDE
ncbi:MAG: DUF5677 domain-containing protein [Ruminococcus sp.]|nr:DUF5677 domain-containing protein [Ruminococcus sp.]